ncbi:DUF6314 family protein [Pseudothioclava nitratireducens]|uniref:DUF6314 family protein n=1 Tax=Pseudothioclava nitratireducens TaxID=1928646 RepID=UPI0023DC5C8D|nr:DUF6314 family protein [Defluviimonas nitratireducens]MDF1620017.1 DUF6314 family protein [Defluviimonas nitratireducens]
MVLRLSDFEGLWLVSRVIRPKDAPEGRFEGQARFTRDGACLRYFEEGELTLPGSGPMHAERAYLWRRGGKGIIVDFADGRAFHSFDPAVPEATHWCDPDDYAVRYEFDRWPEWRAEWRVKGPRKDYVMVTDYRRA